MNYYNEIDPFAAQWLQELIKAGLIPVGDVDQRSIEDVSPTDLEPYNQCHFFAGISDWPLALQLAGWPAERPVWTGSVSCTPFSAAGKRAGFNDHRHLWPAFFWLIEQCCPPVIFGEQVSSKIAVEWWDLVASDLEGANYAAAAADLPAASVGAPHKRSRLFWVAHPESQSRGKRTHRHAVERTKTLGCCGSDGISQGCAASCMEYTNGQRQQEQRVALSDVEESASSQLSGAASCVEYTISQRWEEPEAIASGTKEPMSEEIWTGAAGADGKFNRWDDCEWIDCLDGKARPVKPGIRLLVDGFPGRVATLRGFGNAIVPPLAAEFIQSYLEAIAFSE